MPTAEQLGIFPQASRPKRRGGYLPYFSRAPEQSANMREPEVGSRDYEIIRAVYQNRFLTQSLLSLLFPPLQPTPRRQPQLSAEIPEAGLPSSEPVTLGKYSGKKLLGRLNLLFHHKYLKRIPAGPDLRREVGNQFVYALDTEGAKLLREGGEEIKDSISWYEKNRGISEMFVKHSLMLARFRTALELALRGHEGLSLVSFEREAHPVRWRHNGKGRELAVEPDAYMVLRDHKRNADLVYCVEVDRSSMQNNRMLDKFTRYSLLYTNSQQAAFRVLTITKSKERAQNLHDTATRGDSLNLPKFTALPKGYIMPAEHHPFFYFTDENNFLANPQNILASIWHRAGEPWLTEANHERTRAIIADPLRRVG